MNLMVWGAEKPVRECNKISGSTYGGSERGVGESVRGRYSTGETSASSSTISSEMAIKFYVPYTCAPQNIFHHNYSKDP
jgi:hypothetical protein